VSQVAKTLYRHGLTGEGLDSGLLAALPIVLHGIPVQRCWAHKIRNILDKVRKADQPNVKRALHKVMHAHNQPCRALGRLSVGRSLRGRATPMRLHACATTSTNCSPASATNPRSNVEGTNRQRHRTTLPRSSAAD
jgi:transposase-like protein